MLGGLRRSGSEARVSRRVRVVRLFGIDPEEDRLRIRAFRATPPGRAGQEDERRQVFAAALGQFDELLTAAGSVGPASRPLPLYYALNQAARAIAAALQQPDREWRPQSHGLKIGQPHPAALGHTPIIPRPWMNKKTEQPIDSFSILAEATGSPILSEATTVSNVWAAIPGLDAPGLGGGCPRPLRVDPDPGTHRFAGHLEPVPGLVPNEEGVEQLVRMMRDNYPSAADGFEVAGFRTSGLPTDGPQARVQWLSPNGTPRTLDMVATRYLGAAGPFWLFPALNPAGDELPPLLLWWCLLHALSHIARYHSAEWMAALDPTRSPLAVPVEKTLSIALAIVPRLIVLVLAPGAY